MSHALFPYSLIHTRESMHPIYFDDMGESERAVSPGFVQHLHVVLCLCLWGGTEGLDSITACCFIACLQEV